MGAIGTRNRTDDDEDVDLFSTLFHDQLLVDADDFVFLHDVNLFHSIWVEKEKVN